MHRFTIVFCLISRLIYGTHTVQHQMYSHVTRRSRSNSQPVETGYIYSQFDDKPGRFATFGDTPNGRSPYESNKHFETKSADKLGTFSPMFADQTSPGPLERITPHTTPSILQSEVNYALDKAKSESNYESSRRQSDGMLDKLKRLVRYKGPPDALNDVMTMYDSGNDFHMDDDDVRTSTRSLYDNWPYFYHSPYEYEHNKDISDTEKAKDKRYAADSVHDYIPMREAIENDFPNNYEITPKYFRDENDNPIVGDEPFFSFVLNDYFERSNEEDPLLFRGLDWGKDFDHETYQPGLEDFRRNRRLGKDYHTSENPVTNFVKEINNAVHSSTEEGKKKAHEFDNYNKGAKKSSSKKKGFVNTANSYGGFKDFLDSFANKFGAEDHKKNNNYIQQTNQDKGENRKGFRRVYHKDEYQEDNEFYDKNNSSTKTEVKGDSNVHIGGSEAHLGSHAAAAIGNQTSAANVAGNSIDNTFENSHQGHDKSKTNQLNKYINVAKQAAQSNSADYPEQYKI